VEKDHGIQAQAAQILVVCRRTLTDRVLALGWQSLPDATARAAPGTALARSFCETQSFL